MALLVELGESLHLIGPQRSQPLAVSEGAHAPPLAVATRVYGGRGPGYVFPSVCGLSLWTT